MTLNYYLLILETLNINNVYMQGSFNYLRNKQETQKKKKAKASQIGGRKKIVLSASNTHCRTQSLLISLEFYRQKY